MELTRLDASEDGVAEVVAFMARLNREATHHVFYCDEEDTALRRSLAGFSLPPEKTFVIARESGKIRGVLGFDADMRLGRAWAYGPFIEHAEQRQTAEALWNAAEPLLPAEVREIELAFDVRNKGLERFVEHHRMSHYRDLSVLSLRHDDWSPVALGTHDVEPLRDDDVKAFERLHDEMFPATFWAGPDVVGRLNDERRVLVAKRSGAVIGYVYSEVDPSIGQGGIEFLAVAPDLRRRGVGNALVESSLRWIFSVPEVDEVFVIVDDENPAGERLFGGFGFRMIRRMRAFRTRRDDAPRGDPPDPSQS
ncbi:MAG: GNAT family N-acetyltransferase [Actinomycetota bacterium]